jgi:hypothetical protein
MSDYIPPMDKIRSALSTGDVGRGSGGKIGGAPQPSAPAQKTVVRYGTDSNGKRVAQFSDGTIGPAQ